MRPLSAYDIVRITEWGHDKHALDRALVLLRAAAPGTSPDELARLPIGRRDALLLRLRRSTFGSSLEVRISCPICADRMELAVTVEQLLVASPPLPAELVLTHAGLEIRYRLPNSLDLASIATTRDASVAREQLIVRCVLAATFEDGRAAAELPAETIDLLARAMSEADPQADIRFGLECPQQQHGFVATLDIMAIFWTELRTYAVRVESDVHEIARVYGWTEATILSMSSRRRARYAELASRG
jgi:hypothetical protein